MTGSACEGIKDLLADVASGVLSPEEVGPIQDHLLSCADCRAELEFLRALRAPLANESAVPPNLEARVQNRVREEFGEALTEGADSGIAEIGNRQGRRWAPAWALSSAAVVVLALGTGIIWNRISTDGALDPLAVASQEPLPEAWLWDDGMVAGAPVFDGLSDEDLEALLEEFEG
jgi:anti-sigma factor RsiW